MILQGPAGVCSVSVNGVLFAPDANGCITTDDPNVIAALTNPNQGWVEYVAPSPTDDAQALEQLTVAQLTDLLKGQGVAIPPGAKKADLVALAQANPAS